MNMKWGAGSYMVNEAQDREICHVDSQDDTGQCLEGQELTSSKQSFP